MTIRPIEEYHGEPVYKVVFIAPNEACLAEAKQRYEDQFIFCESRLGDTPSAIVNGELINRKFNKGTGIKPSAMSWGVRWPIPSALATATTICR